MSNFTTQALINATSFEPGVASFAPRAPRVPAQHHNRTRYARHPAAAGPAGLPVSGVATITNDSRHSHAPLARV